MILNWLKHKQYSILYVVKSENIKKQNLPFVLMLIVEQHHNLQLFDCKEIYVASITMANVIFNLKANDPLQLIGAGLGYIEAFVRNQNRSTDNCVIYLLYHCYTIKDNDGNTQNNKVVVYTTNKSLWTMCKKLQICL